MAVGYTSLGSFSTRFRALVGVSPSEYQAKFAASGVPHVPGCYVFMHGLMRPADSATPEKPARRHVRLRLDRMITNISLFTLYVTDQDEAKDFYVDKLGFEERADVTMGEGFRWVTDRPPRPARAAGHADAARAAARRRDGRGDPPQRWPTGRWAASGSASTTAARPSRSSSPRASMFVQPPAERPYGVEAVIRDNSGNWLVLVEPKDYTPTTSTTSCSEQPGPAERNVVGGANNVALRPRRDGTHSGTIHVVSDDQATTRAGRAVRRAQTVQGRRSSRALRRGREHGSRRRRRSPRRRKAVLGERWCAIGLDGDRVDPRQPSWTGTARTSPPA